MELRTPPFLGWLFAAEPPGPPGHLLPRWLFLRGLGLIYFSAFYSLVFQIRGLIGPAGLLPANVYLQEVAHALGALRYWYAPTLLWVSSSGRALEALCWVGMAASLLLAVNVWPRGMLVVCFVAFLSFVAAAQDFSGYQSDGMLLGAGFLGWFFAPRGLGPRWGEKQPPSRASLFLLQWLWLRIYFESGVAKIAGGDPEWRHLTAMDEYYQNGPLPTWIGWYVQHLPHRFHASVTLATLALELALVWMLFLPRRFRIACFCIVAPWEAGIILTANYTFLNYLVMLLGVLLLDDRLLVSLLPRRWAVPVRENLEKWSVGREEEAELVVFDLKGEQETGRAEASRAARNASPGWLSRIRSRREATGLWLAALLLSWVFYAATAQLVWMILPGFPLPVTPVAALDPFRIAERYGLFGVMTRARHEIEFQGSRDGQNWTAYPFRYKPQDPTKPPRIYAPYQPRFDWNLWFASLGPWREYPFVVRAEELLLEGDRDVLSLFAGNPFPDRPPRRVRAVVWQYRFTDLETKRTQGLWWRREERGLYAPALEREPDGRFVIVAWPATSIPPP